MLGKLFRQAPLLAAICLAAMAMPLAYGQQNQPDKASPPWLAGQLPDALQVGQGILRFLGLSVYDASLFVSARESPTQDIFKRSFALSLRYKMRFTGSSIAQTSIDEIKRLGRGTPEQQTTWLGRMVDVFPDVAREDQLTGIHRPGQGAVFFFNGRFLGQIDDPLFSEAFFSIWLSPDTREPRLREALLEALTASGSTRGAVQTPRVNR
jgi:hypothetical protein